MSDPLFSIVRFDVMLVDEAPFIPAPYLLVAAALVREKIILGGDTQDIPSPDVWGSPLARRKKTVGPQPSAISS